MSHRRALSRPLLALLLSLSSLALVATIAGVRAHAQDDDAEEGGEGEGEDAPAAPEPPPVTNGRAEASAAVGQRGMTFELASKARLYVPPSLPIGSSRRMRFAEVRSSLVPGHVSEGFRRIGPILSFDGAINATSSPVVVSIRQPRPPSRPNTRLVLAMEQATICREGLDPLPNVANLCSGWELLSADHDSAEGRLLAEIPTPGGYRLVFGTVPIQEGMTDDGHMLAH